MLLREFTPLAILYSAPGRTVLGRRRLHILAYLSQEVYKRKGLMERGFYNFDSNNEVLFSLTLQYDIENMVSESLIADSISSSNEHTYRLRNKGERYIISLISDPSLTTYSLRDVLLIVQTVISNK